MAEYEGSRNGSITAALTTGIIGTGLGLLNGNGGVLGSALGGNAMDRRVTHYELELIRELMNKDQRIAIADSENYTDKKLVEVYSALNRQDKELSAKMDAYHHEQQGINMQQAVFNSTISSTAAVLHNQVDQLMHLTKMVVPAYNVSPLPMPRYNDWTEPIVKTDTAPAANA